MTWHVANVTNLIISTESLTVGNIEVRHAENESSMIMDRCGTRTSVILSAHVRKGVLVEVASGRQCFGQGSEDCGCQLEIEEIDSDEERRVRPRRKKETLGMDDTVEVPLTLGLNGSDARGSRESVTHPVVTSIAQRTALDLVLWNDEPERKTERT